MMGVAYMFFQQLNAGSIDLLFLSLFVIAFHLLFLLMFLVLFWLLFSSYFFFFYFMFVLEAQVLFSHCTHISSVARAFPGGRLAKVRKKNFMRKV